MTKLITADELGDSMMEYERNYTDLCKLKTLEERYEYLKLNGAVGDETFGYARYLNQRFYRSSQWLDAKQRVILRDKGYDLGVPTCEIFGRIYVHHMNPITIEQIERNDPALLDPENLISCSYNTHQAITWGNKALLPQPIVVRAARDTCPWDPLRDEIDKVAQEIWPDLKRMRMAEED